MTLRHWLQEKAPVDPPWANEWADRVRPYLFVRLEDNLLIKRPNSVVKLNATGARLLHQLLAGKKLQHVLRGADDEQQAQVAAFLRAVRAQVEGKLDEFSCNPAVDVQPFDMRMCRYPVLSEVALTYRCNLKCAFCYAGCRSVSDNDMSRRTVEQVLHALRDDARAPSVSFTGGEPTLHPELLSSVHYAKLLRMRVNLITNGTLVTEKLAHKLARAGLDSAQVSIEATTADVHDRIVGMPGAFEKAVAAIRRLRDAGIHTHGNTTISSANLEQLGEMPRFVREELGGDRFSMNLIIPTGSAAINEELVVRYSEVAPHLEAVIAAAEREEVEFMWYSPVPMCLFNSIPHGLGSKGCSACDGLISIAPNGDVLPCASCMDPVGNLPRDGFEAVWQSVKARRYREKELAHPLCRTCEHFHICNGACPLYWQHIGFEELECVPEKGRSDL